MFESDPRYVLKKVIAEAKEMGYTFDVGPECEFFNHTQNILACVIVHKKPPACIIFYYLNL